MNITFEDLSAKGKEIIWDVKKQDDDNYEVTVTFDHDANKSLILHAVPGKYVTEDGAAYKDRKLTEEESLKLVDLRVKTWLEQLQQAVFTTKFYGGNINGFISSGEVNGKS